MPPYDTITYSVSDDGIARIVQSRPDMRNAQNVRMTYELNDAFDQAAQDDAVKVVVLSGDGPHFSAGHDLRNSGPVPCDAYPVVGTWGGFADGGAASRMAREEEIYLGMCWRWRNLPKPTIAQVHGKTISGGLMLAWVCDIIVASEDATFQDVVVALGISGVEYFAHPWEFGPRKAKELLFTGGAMTAAEARTIGMVNHVVPAAELEGFTTDLARTIAARPTFALRLAKEAINQTLDVQGQWAALRAAFSLHQLCHSHNEQMFGSLVDPSGLPDAVRR